MAWKLYEGDCLEVMPTLQDDSFDLIILDPPYNINKAEWDKIGSHTEYLSFIECVMCECERLLKDNGSLYLWHNQFPVLSDFQWLIKEKTSLIFKQMIVWDKWNNDIKKGNNLQGAFYKIVHNPALRNYPKMAEYLLFYTFQDETGLNEVYNNPNCFKSLKDYFYNEKLKGKFTNKEINEILGTATNGSGMAGHYFKKDLVQWSLPTKEMYLKLQSTGFFQREYEDLRREYEDLRYTFNQYNNQTSIWTYPIPNKDERENHPTQKPVKLSKNIIKHSSNINDTVLIPFAGSGSEMIASLNLNRNVIGIEQNPQYCQIIKDRLSELNIEEQPHEGQKVLTEF